MVLNSQGSHFIQVFSPLDLSSHIFGRKFHTHSSHTLVPVCLTQGRDQVKMVQKNGIRTVYFIETVSREETFDSLGLLKDLWKTNIF